MSERPIYLAGYVTIESKTAELSVEVLGKKWSRDYNAALALAGKFGGVVASRHWVAQKIGGDPVEKLGLSEVVKEGGK